MFGLHVLPEFPVFSQSGWQKAWLLGKLVSCAAFVDWQHPTDSFVCFHSFSWYALMQFPFCKNPYNLTSHSHRSRETELKSVNQKKNWVDCWIWFRLMFKYKANVRADMTFNMWVIYRENMKSVWRGWKHKVCLTGMPFRASLSRPLMRTKSPDQHMCTELKTVNMGISSFFNKSGERPFTWIFSPCSYTYIWEKIFCL